MAAMIQNDQEKEWMLPLMELRDKLDIKDDRHLRDFRRLRGNVQIFHGRAIHGPYTQESRETWLRELLTAQTWIRKNGPKTVGDIDLITGWLSAQLGIAVDGYVTFDHAAAVEALRNGDADISFMGALPFVLAEAEIGAEPLLSELYRGAPYYTGRVFVRRDSGIETLADLRGSDIAFADPISESGYLYPLEEFVRAGLVKGPKAADDFFGRVYFAGGYQQAMQAMAEGLVDAAGASQYADLLLSPKQQAEVTWIAESPKIPSHVVISRPGLDDNLKEQFTKAMLTLNEPENRSMLAYVYGPDGYVAADPAAFVVECHQPFLGQSVEMLAHRHGCDTNPAGELRSGLRPLLLEVQQHLVSGAPLCIPRHSAKIPARCSFATRSSRNIR